MLHVSYNVNTVTRLSSGDLTSHKFNITLKQVP